MQQVVFNESSSENVVPNYTKYVLGNALLEKGVLSDTRNRISEDQKNRKTEKQKNRKAEKQKMRK